MLRKMLNIFGAVLLLQTVASLDDNKYTIEYTDETFAVEVPKTNNFIMFYAPWCWAYKRFVSTWEELAEQLNKTEGNRVRIGKVDCVTEKIVCRQYDIKFSPTLLFFKAGDNNTATFHGNRDLPLLTEFIDEQLGSLSTTDHQTPKTDEEQEPHSNSTTDA